MLTLSLKFQKLNEILQLALLVVDKVIGKVAANLEILETMNRALTAGTSQKTKKELGTAGNIIQSKANDLGWHICCQRCRGF